MSRRSDRHTTHSLLLSLFSSSEGCSDTKGPSVGGIPRATSGGQDEGWGREVFPSPATPPAVPYFPWGLLWQKGSPRGQRKVTVEQDSSGDTAQS